MVAYEVKLDGRPHIGALTLWIAAIDPFANVSMQLTPDCVTIQELEIQVAVLKEKLDAAVAEARGRYRAFERDRAAGKMELFPGDDSD